VILGRTFSFIVLGVFLFAVGFGSLASARAEEVETPTQAVPRDESRRSQYYLRLGAEDELQFHVHIWGQVRNPGLYLVSDGTDVIGLISLAGGPTDGAKLERTRLVRTAPGQEGIIEVDLKLYTNSGDYSGIPILEPGDTILVPATFWQGVVRFGTVLSVVALFANVIVYATR